MPAPSAAVSDRWWWERSRARLVHAALGPLDLAFEDLACRALGEFLHEPDVPRILVGRHLLLDEGCERRSIRFGTGLECHRGPDFLAELVVRDPQDGDLAHCRMLVKDFLDLARIHVVPAPDDHVLLAVDDEEVAVRIDPRDVAGVKPAVADRLPGRVAAPPVALHDVVALDDDLADLAP